MIYTDFTNVVCCEKNKYGKFHIIQIEVEINNNLFILI
jgi:hypothetical protein